MSNARKIADLLDSSGDVKSTHLDNTSSDLVDDTTTGSNGSHTHTIEPVHYTLCYIMKS